MEPREGVLNVFMPPLSLVEEYLALVGAVEDVARERQQPVRIEGIRRRSIRASRSCR